VIQKANLQAMIDMVWKKKPDTKIVWRECRFHRIMGQTYTNMSSRIFRWKNLADKNNKLIPFCWMAWAEFLR
jgi:hypothetical protein